MTLRGYPDSVVTVCFSTDGQLLYTGSVGGTIKVWRAPRDSAEESVGNAESKPRSTGSQ
jgi:WD40 repeat protein